MNRLAIQPAGTGQPGASSETSEPTRCARLSLGRLLRRANRTVQSTIEARFGAADLNFTQWVVLDLVERAGSMTISDLAASMEITSGALSRIVEGLVARGLLDRHRGVVDRRVVILRLTEAGLGKYEAIRPVVMQRWDELLTDLSADEVAHLAVLLGRFADSIERSAIASRQPVVEA